MSIFKIQMEKEYQRIKKTFETCCFEIPLTVDMSNEITDEHPNHNTNH